MVLGRSLAKTQNADLIQVPQALREMLLALEKSPHLYRRTYSEWYLLGSTTS